MSNEKKELRVKAFCPPPRKGKITFRLPMPTIAAFHDYLAAYAETYKVKADADFVANEILTAFIESDRVFTAYRKRSTAANGDQGESTKNPASS